MRLQRDTILGIDIGGTSVKYGVLTQNFSLTSTAQVKVSSQSNEHLIEQLSGIIGKSEFSTCDAIGIGSPGPIDINRGIIISSANMPNVRDCAIVSELQKRHPQQKIRLDNDANAATLGQKFFGLGKTSDNFAVFTLGTGVGGGCVFNGKLERGINGNFFEVGHIPVRPGVFDSSDDSESPARRCGCGKQNCLETFASATGVSFTYKQATGRQLTAREIAEQANAGDKNAKYAYRVAGNTLGLTTATIVQLMNITHFIFTGGMAAAENLLREEIEKTCRENIFPLFHPLLKIEFTEGDENSGVYGAAALFLE